MTLLLALTACGGDTGTTDDPAEDGGDSTTYRIGICNYVDDASLNQIVENIQTRLEELGQEHGVTFDVSATPTPMCSTRSSPTLSLTTWI